MAMLVIKTPLLTLRPFTLADTSALYPVYQDPDVAAYIGGVDDEEDCKRPVKSAVSHWTTHGFGLFVVRDGGDDGPVIGFCGLHIALWAEPGEVESLIGFVKSARDRIRAPRAAHEARCWYFKTFPNAKRILARVNPLNIKTQQRILSAGYRSLGIERVEGRDEAIFEYLRETSGVP